jgi:hypothetical protein
MAAERSEWSGSRSPGRTRCMLNGTPRTPFATQKEPGRASLFVGRGIKPGRWARRASFLSLMDQNRIHNHDPLERLRLRRPRYFCFISTTIVSTGSRPSLGIRRSMPSSSSLSCSCWFAPKRWAPLIPAKLGRARYSSCQSSTWR